ncbi:hypothetical protein Nepgr_017021 [Nepenthes gracilis]|uniref:Plastid movement impaired 2 n=1 Tax=Nepenthes gracilis TaxID=150966 RepID=A0AAD3XT08_NEPGR|nr:hypothetical protein Nepgr_017021 [Nepenthes gracilis]
MGNSLGGQRRAKIMNISGETMELKTPIRAGEVVKDYPGHVLLDSEAVKHYGVRARPIEPQQTLEPKRLYFLVELPKFPQQAARRVRSGIHMSAKDRLENLLLTRRSNSDMTMMRPAAVDEGRNKEGAVRVRMRLPKAEVARLMSESRDEAEAAEKILDLCVGRSGDGGSMMSGASSSQGKEVAFFDRRRDHPRGSYKMPQQVYGA